MTLFLVGYFKIDIGGSSPPCTKLLDFFNSFVLDQIITEHTHFSPTGFPSIIDLVFAPLSLPCSFSVLPPISCSDHYTTVR